MAIPISAPKTIIASKTEVTEKTYVAPSVATDFFAVTEYAPIIMERERKPREAVTGSISAQKSLQGMRAGSVSFAQEFKGSGTVGTEPEWGLHAKATIGAVHTNEDDIILAASCTTTVLRLATAADIIKTQSLDATMVKDTANGYSIRFIKNHGEGDTLVANTNDWIDVDEGSGEESIQMTAGAYATPALLAAQIQLQLNSNANLSADYSVSYAESTGKYTISRSGGNTSILWKTGVHGSDNTDTHLGTVIGFDDAADDSGAGSYVADNLAYSEVTISPALSLAPAAAIVISGNAAYTPVNEGHPSLSITQYEGNEITSKLVGCKGTALSLGNITTGEIPQINFALQALSYNPQIDGASSITPEYQDQLPPVALGVEFLIDGASVCANNFSLELSQEVTKLLCMGNADGAVSQRVTKREVSGNFDPYADDTTVLPYTKFDANTDVEIMVAVGEKDSSGDWVPGSVVAVYLPQVVYTEIPLENAEGLLKNAIGFQAHSGNSGDELEISIAAL